MLQMLLIAVLVYCAAKCFSYKIGCYALTMFFLEHGGRMPDEAELEECRRRVCQNIAKDILHKW